MSGPARSVNVRRSAVVGLLGSTAVAGLLFAPVFGLPALWPPVLAVVLACYGCVELAARWSRLVSWRPLLILLAGALALIESAAFATTVAGLPTATSLQTLWRGLTVGWLLTLQSTWPARPDSDQLLFVALAVLLAVLLGIELLLRLRSPGTALLPGLMLAGLAQAYQALTGLTAVLAAAAYALPAALLLWADRPNRPATRRHRRLKFTLPNIDIRRIVATAVAVVSCAAIIGFLDPAGLDPYRLKDSFSVPPPQNRFSNPLREIAGRLADPDREIFRYRSDHVVDRWSLVTLDRFDGVNWSSDSHLYRMGLGRTVASDGASRSADVEVGHLPGPWLPSQPIPLAVAGLAPLVDSNTGTLLLEHPAAAGQDRHYQLTWSEPQIDATILTNAQFDQRATQRSGDFGAVPTEIERLARDAVGGSPPTFSTALRLERFLRDHYQLAVDGDLPTGDSWPQLQRFLVESRRGTSEQFAAAYVILARLSGIPARLVVGFRGPAERDGGSFVVRNRDVLAWPEVAIAGVGWVPLDPTATTTAVNPGGSGLSGLAQTTAQMRERLSTEPQSHPTPPPTAAVVADRATAPPGGHAVGAVVVTVISGLLACWLAGVPLVKAVRAWRRRRRTGSDGMTGAWAEVRERLRAHGVACHIGMTPRDLAASAAATAGEPTAQAVLRLGEILDTALWSGAAVTDESVRRAWAEVRSVRRSLAEGPLLVRLRAALDPRPLSPPQKAGPGSRWTQRDE